MTLKNCKVTFQPTNKELEIPVGTPLKEAMDLAGLDFDFPCGGRGKCGKCRVRVIEGAVSPSDSEQAQLSEEEIKAGFRLACSAVVQGDMTVELPLSGTKGHKILVAGAERSMRLDPHLDKVYLDVPQPSIEDQRSDWGRTKNALEAKKGKDYRISLPALQSLPMTLREKKFACTAVVSGDEVVGVESGDTSGKMLGMAFDIGTTTVVGYLLDLLTGKDLGAASTMNPQTKYGADVISRVTFADGKNGLEKLHHSIIDAMNRLIGEAALGAGCSREDIYAVSVVGNSCMHHLFLGLSPKHIALAPYVPVTGSSQEVDAGSLGIEINTAGKVYVLPNIAGFVGADTVGVVLATEMDQSDKIRLAIDIGTNGEIVLGTKDRLLSCSTAAGPAFEGAQISCGMRGTAGAIDSVKFGEDFVYTTIDDEKPEGICGSGLIDVVAGMLNVGVLDAKGRILTPEQLAGTPAERFADRIVEYEGIRSFLMAPAEETAQGRPLCITQKDVRELQLAKGAISTGVEALLESYAIKPEDVFEVILAGAFGNYLDKHSACVIGLIPSCLEDRVKPVGNAAGTGAKVALLSAEEYRRSAQIAGTVEYIELGALHNFMELFSKALYFPSREKQEA